MIGTTIGSYRITGELGEGGMGVVYRAQEILLDREVALKALHPQITRDESRLERFKAEAKALARLHHPNIATLFNFFEQNGVYYMVMEFVDGQTLEDVVRQNGALPLRGALEIFGSGLRGFQHAHERGVIHRDIKPSNLMLTSDGDVKITDFGIARVAGGGKLTQTGKLIGTLEYMSPEQVQGQEQDARSDIYSLGILLFELVTGRMPWTATSDFDIMRSHLEVPAPPARSLIAELPPALDSVITRALNKKPEDRFQTVREMREELEAILSELPPSGAAVFPLVKPTRVADIPTVEAPIVGGAGAAPLMGETRVASAPAVGGEGASGKATMPALLQKKWALPALGVGAGALVLVAFMAFAARNPAQIAPAPTPAPAIIETTEPTPIPTPNDSPAISRGSNANVPSSGQDQEVEPLQPQPTPDPKYANIKIPSDIPGLTSATPAPIAKPKPTAKPTARPVTKSVVKAKSKLKSVTRPKSKPKVVARPKLRVKQVVRARPKPRVVARPKTKPKSSGSSEQARLRALIKGN